MREKIILSCAECKERNYHKTKNTRLPPARGVYRKYCRLCNTHPPHTQTK